LLLLPRANEGARMRVPIVWMIGEGPRERCGRHSWKIRPDSGQPGCPVWLRKRILIASEAPAGPTSVLAALGI
jgi:hypothetical protein